MNWSPQQGRALAAVGEWLRTKSKAFFFLAGYAGTGKTTLARYLAGGQRTLYCAYTGKAASVMRARGCAEATTIHSLIYLPKEKSRARLRELEEALAALPPVDELNRPPESVRHRRFLLEAEVADERRKLKGPSFKLNPDSPARKADLLVIDECSMLDERIALDLLSFEVPILVLGDPAQLPPVRGAGYFTSREPDFLLSEIHRQALDNPIIQLATHVREGRQLEVGHYGDSEVLAVANFDRASVGPDEQVIVGRNATRHRANADRRARLGRVDWRPVAGDRVVCHRNNHDLGILNGVVFEVDASAAVDDLTIELSLREGPIVTCHASPFRGEELPHWADREVEHFEHGYALTCHKAQGSEFDKVVVIDESRAFGADARRWRYTAVTRAARRVRVVI